MNCFTSWHLQAGRVLLAFWLASLYAAGAHAGMERFTYDNPKARAVFWAGEANAWNQTTLPFDKDESGIWVLEIELPPGRNKYKLVVDGKWMEDPKVGVDKEDPHGNSVRVVGDAQDVSSASLPLVPESVAPGPFTFRYSAPTASLVAFAASITNWSQKPMTKGENGVWMYTVNLPPGRLEYKFVLNSKTWLADPSNKNPQDGGGNSTLVVGDPTKVQTESGKESGSEDGDVAETSEEPLSLKKISGPASAGLYTFRIQAPDAKSVSFASSITDWFMKPLKRRRDGIWTYTTFLSPGEVEYKFVVDDQWIADPLNPFTAGENVNSLLVVEAPASGGKSSVTDIDETTGEVSFRLVKPEAKAVFVAGSFNNWSSSASPMVRREDGVWEHRTRLMPGEVLYKFVADNGWIFDPGNPNRETDKGGNSNSVLDIGSSASSKIQHSFVFDPFAQLIMISGTFNSWSHAFMRTAGDGLYEYPVHLPAGKTQYKFVVNGEWMLDPQNQQTDMEEGVKNSLVHMPEGGMSHVFRYQVKQPKTVAIAGSFNGWEKMPMTRQKDGTWAWQARLKEGSYSYGFYVDGVWRLDLMNPVMVQNDKGDYQSGLFVSSSSGQKGLEQKITIQYRKPGVSQVEVFGSMTQWRPLPLDRRPNGDWIASFSLGPGNYPYMLVVDQEWIFDPENPQKIEILPKIKMSMLNVKDPTRMVQGLLDEGKTQRLLSDYAGAISKFQQIIANYSTLVPEAPRALNYIGLCLMDQKNYEDASQKFRQVIQTYPQAKAECAEAHLNLAGALKSMGRPVEARSALNQIKSKYAEMKDYVKAADEQLSYLPADAAPVPPVQDKPAKTESVDRSAQDADVNLSLDVEGLDQIFPSMALLYAEQSHGAVVIRNGSSTAIENATLQFFVPDVMDFPSERKIAVIPAGGQHREPVFPVLTSRVLELTELSYKQAAVTLRFSLNGRQRESRKTVNVAFRGRNDLVWDTTAKVAAFITYNDNPVRDFTRKTLQLFTEDDNPFPSENFAKAARLFDALGALRMAYIRDPNTPYDKIYGNATTIDRVQFPRETLRLKSGDCDDLTVLFSAILENAGVRTRLVTVPEHIFLAFDAGAPQHLLETQVENPDWLVQDGGRVWIPVEVTLIGKSFTESWHEAAKHILKNKGGDLQFTDVSAAWEKYKPCALESTNWSPEIPDKSAILAILAKDDLGSRQKAKAYNRAGTVFAKQGLLEDAFANFKKALTLFPDFSDARNNIANLYLLQGKYTDAVVEYRVSLSLNPEQPSVRFNLAIAFNALGKFDESMAEYQAAKQKDPTLVDDTFESQVKTATQSGLRSEGMSIVQKWKERLVWLQ